MTTVAGYMYRADVYHPGCLVEMMVRTSELSPGAWGMTPEEALDQHAGALAVDRYDESTYDSGEFPKVVFGGLGATCGECHS